MRLRELPMKQIISVSRRTDIPAFYGDWFINRLRAGSAEYRNPMFPEKMHSVSLKKDDVAAFVFWSKNYAPFIKHLDEIDATGIPSIFHYTINGYPKALEPNVPELSDSINTFKRLSDRYSPAKVFLRYDPIVMSGITSVPFHIENFHKIVSELKGYTSRCYFSFVSLYRKTVYNLNKLAKKESFSWKEPASEDVQKLLKSFAMATFGTGITLYSCSNDAQLSNGIQKGHCIDGALIEKITGNRSPLKPTRKDCGCADARDIGAYDTCPHGCAYCYANANYSIAYKNHSAHDATLQLLK